MNIKIYDDLIPKHLQDYYELSILGRTTVEEEIMHPTVDLRCKYESTANEPGVNSLSFVHVLKSSAHRSNHLDNFALIPQIVCQDLKLVLKEIMVARIYLILPYKTELKHYAAHQDFPFKHTVVLYYVNDADGDTVFFDNDNNIVQSVSPKRGRVVVFDGLLYHGGGIPKKSPRCVVNFDILT